MTSRHITRYYTTPRHATPRHAKPRQATPRHVLSRLITSRLATSRHATPRHATPRHVTSRHGTARHGTARHGTSCHVMSHTRIQNTLRKRERDSDGLRDSSNTMSTANTPWFADVITWFMLCKYCRRSIYRHAHVRMRQARAM